MSRRSHALAGRALVQVGAAADRIKQRKDWQDWFLAPEVQLLYKAQYHRPGDEHDFARAVPPLTPAQRAWLARTLAEHYPGDAWTC